MMIRVLMFILLLMSVTFVPIYVFALAVLAYAYYFNEALELVFLGIAVDAFFGLSQSIPYYTLLTGAVVMFMEWLKPQLVFYNR